MLAVCLSDGAGSASHAALGARLVSATTARWLQRRFSWALRAPREAVAERLVGNLQRRLARAALEHGAAEEELAATLVAAAAGPQGEWVVLHLGDGAVIGRVGERLEPLSLPAKGEFANETAMVTDRGAVAALIVRRGEPELGQPPASGFVLFTDGIERLLVDLRTGELAPAVPKMLSWLDAHPPALVSPVLAQTLGDILQPATRDDCTLVLVSSRSPSRTGDGAGNGAPRR